MLSSNFTKTDYIYDHEIPRAFERKKAGDNIAIVPILLNFCDWQTEENNLGKYNGLPYTLKPVSDFHNEEMAWYIIIECLKSIIKEPGLANDGKWEELKEAWPDDVRKIFERIVEGRVDKNT